MYHGYKVVSQVVVCVGEFHIPDLGEDDTVYAIPVLAEEVHGLEGLPAVAGGDNILSVGGYCVGVV